jgi:hypothetical protein
MKISREDSDRLTDKIRDLLNEGKYDEDIIKGLHIGRATFFRYKKKVIRQYVREYQPNKQIIAESRAELLKTLEDGYQLNKKIMDNDMNSPTVRIQASEYCAVYKAQKTKLTEEGYVKPLPLARARIIPNDVTVSTLMDDDKTERQKSNLI